MRASEFHTKEKHEEGTKVFLPAPDGTLTEEFVVVRGKDSSAFRRAQADFRERQVMASVEKTPFDGFVEQAKLTASAIKEWSLEDPLTEASALDFLLNAPYLIDKIDAALFDNKRFFT